MELVFLANNCNLAFIEYGLLAYCNNEKIHKITIFTENSIRNHVIVQNPKVEVIVYPNTIEKPIGTGIYFGWLKEIFLHRKRYLTFSKKKMALSFIRNEAKRAKYISSKSESRHAVFLSYWASSEALILSLLKKYGKKDLMLTRMHAFDIYEEFDNHGHIPWRWLMNEQLDRFITISRHGENYYKAKYPAVADRVFTHYLGIEHPEGRGLNVDPPGKTRIVSCGWVGKRKNLNQIFHSFKDAQNTEWIHIGGGEEFEDLKQLVEGEGKNLDVLLKGSLTSEAIMEFYQAEPITCFISLSKSEGLPVSMMEAMSFGIPVVSTDVGGCSEIVNENTGVLLPENYTDEDVRNAVKLCADKFSSPEARKRIQDECRRKFDAKTNYGRFVDFMIEENRKHWEKMK